MSIFERQCFGLERCLVCPRCLYEGLSLAFLPVPWNIWQGIYSVLSLCGGKWSGAAFFSEEQMPSFMFLKDYRHQGWVTGPESARGRKKRESKAGLVPVGFWWYDWLQICSGISSTEAHSLLMQLLHYQLILHRWALCQNIVFRLCDFSFKLWRINTKTM